MRLGVRGHDFGRMEEADLAKRIKEAGFETVQLALTKALSGLTAFKDITEQRVERVREAFEKEKLGISVLGCYIEPSLLDKKRRLEQVGFFEQGLEHAKQLGAGLVGTETTHFEGTESEREQAYARLKDSVLRMAEKAEKEGIDIGIEPVAEHTLNTPELARRLLDEVGSKRLKVIFDPVNLLLPNTVSEQGQIFASFFEFLGEEISAVHLKDVAIKDNKKEWALLGEGIVDYQYIFDWLKVNKPEISLLRENVRMDSYEKDLATMRRWTLKNFT